MHSGLEKLRFDLEIMEVMAAQMADYIRSAVLFWPIGEAGMPALTLGGCFMRQHRLVALAGLLNSAEQQRLQTAVSSIEDAISGHTVAVEQKAARELAARTRQWGEYLTDLRVEPDQAAAGYTTAVENRVIIHTLLHLPGNAPHPADEQAAERVKALDHNLRQRWQSGAFVWADEWKAAYPPTPYWWLYGQPK